ncbi:protein PLASTID TRANSCRIPTIONALLY ACTIVE 12, chloroplastic isoform X2 [Coffea eugenioides]|uniref:protein PLASTID TRANSCRIPTIONALLY ACTIVE 12, chloroplastic isoform X2 n=1 Tax=Coffea eugenioides TaxID=49369 RepID=UPI000F60DFD8|nr:protein PLASTID TRANSCRIPTIONALLY ACTIVE 12, chloroplastic isoform X2 [Coffea eugenioides]
MVSSISPSWVLCQDNGISRRIVSVDGSVAKRRHLQGSKTSFARAFVTSIWQLKVGLHHSSGNVRLLPCIKCENSNKEGSSFEQVSVEPPPYHSYLDSTSGQLEPASGARASIPGQEFWPEGTASRVRAARAPEPMGASTTSPSYGQNPGSRRKKYKASVASSETSETSGVPDIPDDVLEEPKELLSEYVVYQSEPEEENLSDYEMDKKIGRPHPFIDPKAKKPVEEPLTSEELWWNWRKPEKEQWSRWQRRRPDVETVFLKAMAETGQIKLYGDHPTLTETSLYRARRHIYKEERLKAEQERLEKIGPLAYYSEWVKAWKRDTSREAVQKHFEETGEDENTQLIEMFTHQTDQEYRIMMVWGGDPVYPTINYIQDPDAVIDFRGPDFHEPTPDMLVYLKEHGKIISREELEMKLAKEKTEELEMTDMDEAMAQAVDIGENDDEGEESDDGEEEKISRNWSILKSNPELRKSKGKPKNNNLSLEEAIDDSENLTDFLMDFEEDE